MKDFCVVGSGISGSIVSNTLSKKYSIEIFEKSRGVGGRSSNRRFKNNLSFDHGLQYISPKSKNFKKFINLLEKKKIVKEWKGVHTDLFNSDLKIKKKKFIGNKGNNSISKYLTKKIKINFSTTIKRANFKNKYWEIVTSDNKKIYFKNLIFSIPYPQIKKIVKKYLDKKILNLNVKMKPNLTLMLIYKNCKKNSISSIKFNDKIISWASNENSKLRFKSKLQLWTIQSNSQWSSVFINKYKKKKKLVINKMIDRFSKLSDYKNKNIIFQDIHGWKYSYNEKPTNIKSFWSKKYKLGLCGDWFLGPKAENAWESSVDLCKKIY